MLLLTATVWSPSAHAEAVQIPPPVNPPPVNPPCGQPPTTVPPVSNPPPSNPATNGPTLGDFMDEGCHPDITGYLAALAAFQDAPHIALGSIVRILVGNEEVGGPSEIDLLSSPLMLFTGTVASDPGDYTVTMPDELTLGFHRFRIRDLTPDGQPQLRDIVINVVPAGSPDAVSTVSIGLGDVGVLDTQQSATPARTGADIQTEVGYAVALTLVGGALLVAGYRWRRARLVQST